MTQDMWSNEQKLDALLKLPWSLRMTQNTEEGYWVMRVEELPAALATAETPHALEGAFWESLRETLSVFLEHGDVIPLPAVVKRYPWQPREDVRVVQGQVQETAAAAFIAAQSNSPFAHA